MQAPNRTYVGPVALARELARAGVRHACIAPGSRSAPLALALAAEPGLRTWSHVDERSAGFFALGLAKATRTPVAIACTSGTAAANLVPAVVEAWHAAVPLVVLTADRPPELRDVGAGQAIDQIGLFGTHVRWFVEVGTPETSAEWVRWVRTLAARAVARATGTPAGPVHLNCAFRDPLVPDVGPAVDVPPVRGEEPHVRIHAAAAAPDARGVAAVAALLRRARRPLVVAGLMDEADPSLPAAVATLARALGAPLVAELASNLRGPATADVLVDAHDALLRHPGFAAAHAPDAVVRLGLPPTSKVTATWLAGQTGVPQILLGGTPGWAEPAGVATHALGGAPAETCRALAVSLGEPAPAASWRSGWQQAGAVARAALECAVHAEPGLFEPHAVAALATTLPADARLVVGNSLAIREADWFWPATAPAPHVLANRGANGIDGFVSTVLGVAAADPSRPVVGLCGDLSFLHDMHGLLAVRRLGVRATFVVCDNDGGGIFDFLPVAAQPPAVYEPLFATPHGLDVAPIVHAYGAACVDAATPADVAPAVRAALTAPVTTVVRLRFARAASRAAHERVFARAVEALA
jgi:2-succinyl-5-enolpyruvyl-6-hydroxy-3-cyclohexene-1-carboxylate synthase